MNIEKGLKNLKVAAKLNVYRGCMVAVILLMGIVSVVMGLVMNAKLHEITDVWSPSLSYVQALNTLTSDYRIKQYGHLVSVDDTHMTSYEEELATVEEQIAETSALFQSVISTKYEQEKYQVVHEKWELYKEQSEEIMEMSRAGKTESAGLLMIDEVYDTYNEFCTTFEELQTYESAELQSAKTVVKVIVIVMVVIIVLSTVCAIFLATSIGKAIGNMITEPVAQIETAIISMREGDFSKADQLSYESEDELGIVEEKLRETMETLTAYVGEISEELRRIAGGDLTRNGEDITDFLGEFSDIKTSLLYILKRFNSTLSEIQQTSAQVASGAEEISKASQALAEGATEQAGAVEELTATVNTVSELAVDSAKATQRAYEQIKASSDKAEAEKAKMEELTTEMERITEISKEIENIITAIEDIASQTNLLSLNASIEAARAGEAGRGFAVVADQIGKLAADSAQSAVSTRNLIGKTLEEIEKGNAITISTSESFERIITDMKSFAELAHQSTENADKQAEALEQIEEGIEQIAGAVENTAASSEENSAISVNMSEKSEQLDGLVQRFKLF